MQRENTVAWNRLFESGYETEKVRRLILKQEGFVT
jgi:hypothetical protein